MNGNMRIKWIQIFYLLTLLVGLPISLVGCTKSLADQEEVIDEEQTGRAVLRIPLQVASFDVPASRAAATNTVGLSAPVSLTDGQLDTYNLRSTWDYFIGNVRVFLAKSDGTIVASKRFVASNPDAGEGYIELDDEGRPKSITWDITNVPNYTTVTRINVLANEPYTVDSSTGAISNALDDQNFTKVSELNNLTFNAIFHTENELRTLAGRQVKPTGIFRTGNLGIGVSVNFADMKSTNATLKANPIQLRPHCTKIVVDVLNQKQTPNAINTRFLGAKITNLPLTITTSSPGTSTYSGGTRTYDYPNLDNGNFIKTNPDSVRYVFYTGGYNFGNETNLPTLNFYTSTSSELTYNTNQPDLESYAERVYKVLLRGGVGLVRTDQILAGRINYFRLNFTGHAPDVYEIEFLPAENVTHTINVDFDGSGVHRNTN